MAAGLGFKTFTTGEVLTAGDVNGYLMQGVLVFATAAARNSAITSPQEGQFAFTKDTNGLWYYDGVAWVASGATGDIEGVTAGVGITGGGTSGTVTITNDMATTITTAGDLIKGTGSGTYNRLGIGSTGQVLTVASGAPSWATPASGGTTLISTTTMSGASVTLSSIPQTYTYLLLVFNEFTNSTGDGYFKIDTNNANAACRISGLTTAGSFSDTTNVLRLPNTYDRTNADNGGQIQIYNYTAANNYNKAFIWTGNYYAGNVGFIAGGITSSIDGAITSIVLSNTGGNWAGGTTYFYGVK